MSKSRVGEHFDALENQLLSEAKKLSSVYHTTIVGSAREFFVKNFLRKHLGEMYGVGSGEIIASKKPSDLNERQQDIIIYDKKYPKLNLAEELDSFLIESVFCTIEVKTTLTEEEYKKAALAACELSEWWKLQSDSMLRPTPRRFLVAFDGPAKMETVIGWMKKLYSSNIRQSQRMPFVEAYFKGPNEVPRNEHRSSSLDGIFVFGKGFIIMDSFEFRFYGAGSKEYGVLKSKIFDYVCVNINNGSLGMLFTCLMDVMSQTKLMSDYLGKFSTKPLISFHEMPGPQKI